MSAVTDLIVSIEGALVGVSSVAVTRDPGATLALPAVILGSPSLTWEAGCAGPTSARLTVYVTVESSERSVEQLWGLVIDVADALDTLPDVAVLSASPALYQSDTVQLPCYEILLEASLR